MDDHALVALMIRRDPAGLEGVYRRYADRLYAYCVSTLRDRDAAADVVHDTFLIALQQIHQLRDPERLSAWLYAVAQRECLRTLRRTARDVPLSAAPEPGGAGGDDPAGDVMVAAHAREVGELVGAAVDGVGDADREVIHLSLRDGLTAPEIAAALGVSVNHANARLSRARSGLLQALGALILARTAACPQVTALTAGWTGRLDPLLRKRISRHARDCEQCAADLRERLHPVALLSAYGTLPLFAVPASLWARVRDGAAGHTAGPSDTLADQTRHVAANRAAGRWWAAAAAIAAVAVAATLLTPSARGTAPTATDAVPIAAATPDAALRGGPSATGSTTGSTAGPTAGPPSPSRTESPNPAGSRTPSASRPPDRTTFTVTARAAATCTGSVGFQLSVTATGTKPLRTALLYWRAPDLDREAMTRSGVTATVDVPRLRAPVTWWVEAVAVDGRRFTTAPVTTADPC